MQITGFPSHFFTKHRLHLQASHVLTTVVGAVAGQTLPDPAVFGMCPCRWCSKKLTSATLDDELVRNEEVILRIRG